MFCHFFPSTVNIRKSKSSMYRITTIAINNLSDSLCSEVSEVWVDQTILPDPSWVDNLQNFHQKIMRILQSFNSEFTPEKWDGAGRRSLKKTLYTLAPPKPLQQWENTLFIIE